MKLVVGLGNPGVRYRFHRHNAGFLVVDQIALQHDMSIAQTLCDAHVGKGKIAGSAVLLAKPQTFMNLSGAAVRQLTDYYRIECNDVVVVHDDLDLPFETIRLKAGGGHGGHKGLVSIIDHLGTPDFLRLRLGIGRPEHKSMVESYVLSPFSDEETNRLPALLKIASGAVADIIFSGIRAAMEQHHGKDHSHLNKED